jgi:RNA polymerase sigma factor (sigma-70 family)
MSEDAELLQRYARDRAEDALAEVVKRHIGFVYRVALQEIGGDAHHASDVTQAVFIQVARKAGLLAQHRVLKGWLFITARYLAANVIRSERRRHHREKEAHAMQQLGNESEPSADWANARPLITNALGKLSQRDREAVLLRYFEGQDYAQIGARLSLSADAARLRVERALERMRVALARSGVASTTAALAATLTTQAALPVPTGLETIVTGAALASGATGAGVANFLTLMCTTKTQAALLAGILLIGGLGMLLQQRARATLLHQLVDLHREDVQAARLRMENARLASPFGGVEEPAANELAQLRNRSDELKQRLATLAAPSLAPGMIASSDWLNRGRATAGHALETLLWAKEGADFGQLTEIMDLSSLSSTTLAKLERVFAMMTKNMRNTLGVASPAELVALQFCLGRKFEAPVVGAQFVGATPDQGGDLLLSVKMQHADGRIRSYRDMRFRQAAEGWRWMLTTADVEEMANKLDTKAGGAASTKL